MSRLCKHSLLAAVTVVVSAVVLVDGDSIDLWVRDDNVRLLDGRGEG